MFEMTIVFVYFSERYHINAHSIMKTTISFAIITVLLLSLFSCKKYPEGPSLTIRSKEGRVDNKWKIDKWIIGGVDSVMYYAAEGTFIELTKDGKVTATQIQAYGGQTLTTTYTGEWQFSDNKEELAWIITDNWGNPADTSVFNILKLKHKEFWIEDEDDDPNKTSVLQLIPF